MSAPPPLTPEFLLWAVEYSCPLRAGEDGSDPDRVERQLRAARAVSDARHQGRVLEGIAAQPPDGFRISDALAIYGGESAALACCGHCPANVLHAENEPGLAGCYGCVVLPLDPTNVHAAVERGFEIAGSRQKIDTRPCWYGLWRQSPLWAELLLDTILILEAAPIDDLETKRGVDELRQGLNAAYNHNCRLHVRLYPSGYVERGWWRLMPHCPRCKARWPSDQSRSCTVCGSAGHPAPDKKRRVRGRRPYAPLDRLLGNDEAAAYLARYSDFQARERSPDPAGIPPRPAPPDNRPDGSDF